MIAPSDIAVLLIEGERGTGKKLVAKTIHEIGTRVNGPFIMVDSSSMSDVLSESVLLGHEKGAFLGATQKKKALSKWRIMGQSYSMKSTSFRQKVKP